LRVIKRQLWDDQLRGLGPSVAVAQAEMELSFQSEDFAEGIAHFLERRNPAFTGR
jgi:enoyl-CoA hydratase/carnithine racemase